ncbi:MAG: TetR/AcrR family transcriptional regulator [Roseibium sp.]
MSEAKEKLAAGLEQVFWNRGFSDPSVPDLRAGVGVSMRTLYRYFPSREAMILGALEYRHHRYLSYVQEGVSEPGLAASEQLFDKLGGWMRLTEGKECFFRQAMAANPDSVEISATVKRHKAELLTFFGTLSGHMGFATTLYLLHEGVTASYAELGERAVEEAKVMVRQMFKKANESLLS